MPRRGTLHIPLPDFLSMNTVLGKDPGNTGLAERTSDSEGLACRRVGFGIHSIGRAMSSLTLLTLPLHCRR